MTDVSDHEIGILMRDGIRRMTTLQPLTRTELRDVYDEYRKRSLDSRDDNPSRGYPPIHPEARMNHAPSNVCGRCTQPIDDHSFKRNRPVCPEVA